MNDRTTDDLGGGDGIRSYTPDMPAPATPSICEIIARLGHAVGLEWARCREVEPDAPSSRSQCSLERGHGNLHNHIDPHDDDYTYCWPGAESTLPPTLTEWAAEWERERPGEPGPVASWTDGRVSWSVEDVGPEGSSMLAIRIQVGSVEGLFYGPIRRITSGMDENVVADAAECVRLMQAVDGGTR